MHNVRLIFIHNFLTDCRFQEAFKVIYFAQLTGSYTVAMSVLAVATVAKALTEIPTGILSDKIGRKYTIAFGSVCATLELICYAFAEAQNLLFLGAMFSGLGQALFSGNNNALLYETLKTHGQEAQYHHYCGRTASMFQAALGLSAFIAIFLSHDGLRHLFMLGIIPQCLAIVVCLFFQEPSIHTHFGQNSFTLLMQSFSKIG